MKKEACGLFGVINHNDAPYLTFLGLQALQHRGQESCGIASYSSEFHIKKEMGLVRDGFKESDFLGDGLRFHGKIAIGHIRYSTTGDSNKNNIQPISLDTKFGKITTAHNGNLTNTELLKLQLNGTKLKTSTDSELILHLINNSNKSNLDDAIVDALREQDGAFCQLFLTKNTIYASRDCYGFHPLHLAKLNGNTHILASETCALDLLKAKYLRKIRPGELIKLNKNKVSSTQFKKAKPASCAFEDVYFSRPDECFGEIAILRQSLGAKLWEESPVNADLVSSVPDSGNRCAEGFAFASRIPYMNAFVRNHYTHRTFINPNQDSRIKNIETKLNVVKKLVKGKRVVICDDSIVRGNTCKSRVKNLREAGAIEVHLRISCPPLKYPCYMGIDFNTKNQLIAHTHSIEKIKKLTGADSLAYISQSGFEEILGNKKCYACWTGKYPCDIRYRARSK